MSPSSTTLKKLVLVTGATQGIGLETARDLLLNYPNWHVLLGARDLERGNETVSKLQSLPNVKGTVELLHLDVADDASVDAAAAMVETKHGRLDTLVNNAGISNVQRGRDVARQVFAVNVFGLISVTDAFLPLLKKSEAPHMIVVSSSMGTLSYASDPSHQLHFDFVPEYRASKAAANMLMVQYQWQGLKVHSYDPGLVATRFGGATEEQVEMKKKRGGVSPEEAATHLVDIIEGKRDADARKAIHGKGIHPW